MSEYFLGEIRAFSFGFAPKGWAFCNGQTLPINQYQALFSLIGTQFGGNGTTNFLLPNLQGTLPIGVNQIATSIGQRLGEEFHTLTTSQIPQHTHTINAYTAPANPTNTPASTVLLATATTDQTGNPNVLAYGANTPNTPMAPLDPAGGSQPHENRMPFLVMSYCIALQGIFPTRN
jgi:microcystin-dependent protein